MNSGTGKQSSSHRSWPVLAVTSGDMNGIGPEIILKSLSDDQLKSIGILLFAPEHTMDFYAGRSQISPVWKTVDSGKFKVDDNGDAGAGAAFPEPLPGEICLIPVSGPVEPVSPGTISAAAGTLAMNAIAMAVSTCIESKADALVTAPISKEAIQKAGYRVPGHTEYLAELTQTRNAGMMLVNREMRIGLATIHLPLRDVASHITRELLETRIDLFHKALQSDFGIAEPGIAVLGLNPHAGDGGVLGDEELHIITPVVEQLQRQGVQISGPYAADGFFGSGSYRDMDLTFAMYHDQGLIPVKMTGFENGVNVTCGLPVIRTSPDHGTAFSIAGKNKAHPGSMLAAIRLACEIIKHRSGSVA